MGTGVPLYYHQGTTKSSGLADTQGPVKQILKHRVQNGKIQFLTRWKGASTHEDTWENIDRFVKSLPDPFLEYVFNAGLAPEMWKWFYFDTA